MNSWNYFGLMECGGGSETFVCCASVERGSRLSCRVDCSKKAFTKYPSLSASWRMEWLVGWTDGCGGLLIGRRCLQKSYSYFLTSFGFGLVLACWFEDCVWFCVCFKRSVLCVRVLPRVELKSRLLSIEDGVVAVFYGSSLLGLV